jgi:hypothetical protein
MSDDYDLVIGQIADLRRQMAETFQTGTVKEVKGNKMRMVLGKDEDGEEILSPWLNTNNHRGGATEARYYKKGQTLSLIAPNGDVGQGMISPYAPNKDFPRPEHANESSEGEESYQLEDYRGKQTKEGYDNWLQEDDSKKQGGGGGQKKDSKGHTGGDKATIKARMNKDGGHTLRVGKDVRLAANKEGAKLRAGSDFVVVKKGKIIFSQPPELGADPLKNDDK